MLALDSSLAQCSAYLNAALLGCFHTPSLQRLLFSYVDNWWYCVCLAWRRR